MQRLAMIGVLVAAARIATADSNHCEVAVTGEATANLKLDAPAGAQEGKVTAATDYWMTDDQLRTGLSIMVGLGEKMTPAEKAKKVDEAMKKDPRFVILMINCLGDAGGLILGAASTTKYANVPFKPGTYPIVPSDHAKAGEQTVMFHLMASGKRESYFVTTPGKLVLTQFDKKGIAGTFTFGATQRYGGSKKVSVTGSFRYACVGDACAK